MRKIPKPSNSWMDHKIKEKLPSKIKAMVSMHEGGLGKSHPWKRHCPI